MIENAWLRAMATIAVVLSLGSGCSSTTSPSSAGADGSGSGTSDPYATGDASGGALVGSADGLSGVQSGDLEQASGVLDYVYYFDFDTSELSLEVRARLDQTAAAMRSKSGLIRLEGHADERGTREYNLALGERRAKAVANYLAIQGVPNSQIEIISYGEEKPAALGGGEASWAQNRRVELIYID